MSPTQDKTPTPTAKPRSVSLYDIHHDYVQKRADVLTARTGKPVNVSKYIQQLIEADMRKHSRENTKHPN